jgi:glutathione S-transferase
MFFAGSTRKTFGSLPVVQRSDGTYMKETVPICRYIARHHGYYPTNTLEALRNDWFVEQY